jgi:hypothetical protein
LKCKGRDSRQNSTGQLAKHECAISPWKQKRQSWKKKRAKIQAKKKKLLPLLLTLDVSAFVIEDRVKISEEDTETLRFVIEEGNDRMMDVDCLMQENIGLKQLIRQISEGA